jgi:hypothetical protein
MKLIGLDCGPLRLPLPSLTLEQEGALQKAMGELGFFRSMV